MSTWGRFSRANHTFAECSRIIRVFIPKSIAFSQALELFSYHLSCQWSDQSAWKWPLGKHAREQIDIVDWSEMVKLRSWSLRWLCKEPLTHRLSSKLPQLHYPSNAANLRISKAPITESVLETSCMAEDHDRVHVGYSTIPDPIPISDRQA